MACFSPKLIMPAVSFIGTNVAADMQERGGKVGPNAIKAAVQNAEIAAHSPLRFASQEA